MKWSKENIEQQIKNYSNIKEWRADSDSSYKAALRLSKTDEQWFIKIKNSLSKQHKCIECKKLFYRKTHNSITCSKECSSNRRKQKISEWCNSNQSYHSDYREENRDHRKVINKLWAEIIKKFAMKKQEDIKQLN